MTNPPTIRPDAVDYLDRQQTAADLRAVREQWGDLLAAIDCPPRAEWPPRDSRALGATPEAEAEPNDTPAVGRLPLILREHPAPLNLTALNAAVETERELFQLCDTVAAAVQRPVRRRYHRPQPVRGRAAPRGGYRSQAYIDSADRADPARWRTASPTTPGSRTHGLHWAAVWLEGRALGEESGDLFSPVLPPLSETIATTARRARARVERALGRDNQPTQLGQPCPYCRGPLTAYTRSGDPAAATIECGTGSNCTAPVPLNGRRRREWAGAELVSFYVALNAAQRRAKR